MKTPQKPYSEFSHILGVPELWFKREDLHPYGSHKGRSIPQMIKEYAKTGIKKFVISSSGNAALAAVIAIQKHSQNNPGSSLELTVFVGEHIDESKLKILYKEIQNNPQIHIQKVENPKQMAFQCEKENPETIKNLRQSTDDLALRGYTELAEDLAKIPNLQAVFIPTSSGTTAQALGEAFVKMNLPIQIHIVQTTSCHPIASVFESAESDEASLAGAIVDHIAHRKDKVVDAIKNTQGHGWIVSNDEIQNALKLIKQNTDFVASPNSALSLSGLIKAKENGWTWAGTICCLITGK